MNSKTKDPWTLIGTAVHQLVDLLRTRCRLILLRSSEGQEPEHRRMLETRDWSKTVLSVLDPSILQLSTVKFFQRILVVRHLFFFLSFVISSPWFTTKSAFV